jgi:hypothetical protein
MKNFKMLLSVLFVFLTGAVMAQSAPVTSGGAAVTTASGFGLTIDWSHVCRNVLLDVDWCGSRAVVWFYCRQWWIQMGHWYV